MMLVLLIIFMVTAPMLMQGVQVDLPDAPAEPVENQDSEPLIVSVDKAGRLYINLGRNDKQALELATTNSGIRSIAPGSR